MKHWYCSRINFDFDQIETMSKVLDECDSIENDGYKVEQIVYANGQYQIFYSKEGDFE